MRGWRHDENGDSIEVDRTVDEARAAEFDALLLPVGAMNPDRLRQDEHAVRCVREFFQAGKPVAAICHGPQLLIEADVVEGRRFTSYASIRTDLVNADAEWVDQAVVCDQGLVSSRKPDDLPAFHAKLIREIAEGVPFAAAARAPSPNGS